ncbi:MAG: 5'/3'-nucleotidase SurE [Puniceicoccales bacterium]|jgi:5'-nucleotidase|nr:5'/3'-nucleotidase SurE [Puniceicoccales bacterium]
MRVLLTNDDSIYSVALQRLTCALIEKKWEVYVVAPDSERSGVGCACTLTRGISVVPFQEFNCPAWAISGTPLDCVNLALSHLLKGSLPDVIISGINWGINVSIPMIFSSGTVGGAIEGTVFGIPSIAVSQCLPGQDGQYIQKKIDFLAHEGLMKSIDVAVQKTIGYAETVAQTSENVVHNINFPYPVTPETTEEITRLSSIIHGKGVSCSLYEKEGDKYYFAIQSDLSLAPVPGSDIDALLRGKISYSTIDLKRLC